MSIILNSDPVEDKKSQKAWRCPKCGRTFRQHVIAECTHASGPVCNKCAVELEWMDTDVGATEHRPSQRAM